MTLSGPALCVAKLRSSMFLLAEMELMFWQNSTLLMKMSAWRKKTVDRIHTKGLTPPSLKLPSKLKLRNAPYAWDKTFTH